MTDASIFHGSIKNSLSLEMKMRKRRICQRCLDDGDDDDEPWNFVKPNRMFKASDPLLVWVIFLLFIGQCRDRSVLHTSNSRLCDSTRPASASFLLVPNPCLSASCHSTRHSHVSCASHLKPRVKKDINLSSGSRSRRAFFPWDCEASKMPENRFGLRVTSSDVRSSCFVFISL